MEKSNSNTSQKHGSGDEGNTQRDDEQPTTSRGDNFNPEQISHNMNDLKALDFNSADEVRQAMKAVLAGKLPPQSFSEEANNFQPKVQNDSEPVKINELGNKTHGKDGHKTVQRQVQQNLYQKLKSTAWIFKANALGSSRLRIGRVPKGGATRTIEKSRIASMYQGKLSNVVPFRRRWEPESESDVESVIIFY